MNHGSTNQGNGAAHLPQLFEVFTDHPHRVRYDEQPWKASPSESAYLAYNDLERILPMFVDATGAALEPPDQPPVRITDELLFETGWRRGSYVSLDAKPRFGSETALPRVLANRPFRQLEDELVSVEVFVALQSLAPACVSSIANYEVGFRQTNTEYHLYEVNPFTGGGSSAVVRSLCDPAIPEGVDLVIYVDELIAAGVLPVLAFDSSMARDDCFLSLGSSKMIVTEGFRDAWLATELSRQLREDPREQDLWFVPSNGGFGDGATYRWVDASSS